MKEKIRDISNTDEKGYHAYNWIPSREEKETKERQRAQPIFNKTMAENFSKLMTINYRFTKHYES